MYYRTNKTFEPIRFEILHSLSCRSTICIIMLRNQSHHACVITWSERANAAWSSSTGSSFIGRAHPFWLHTSTNHVALPLKQRRLRLARIPVTWLLTVIVAWIKGMNWLLIFWTVFPNFWKAIHSDWLLSLLHIYNNPCPGSHIVTETSISVRCTISITTICLSMPYNEAFKSDAIVNQILLIINSTCC